MAIRKTMKQKGFTLIELLVVMAIVATLLSIVAPRYFNSLDKAKEAVLRQDLGIMRNAIDQFYSDFGKYPIDLVELVDKHRALGAQAVDHVLVVHHFVTDVDRCAEQRQRPLDDGDGAFDAGAEAARARQQDVRHRIPTISTSKRTPLPASG